MIQKIINKIFEESSFNNNEHYYSKDDNQFYLTLKLDESEFSSIGHKNTIEENSSYKKLLEYFNGLVKSGGSISIEKNTSLLIFVKCLNIAALEEYMQQILLIEEDEYFFKKYVVLYTDNAISNLNTGRILEDLQVKLNNKEHFESYYVNGVNSKLEEYLFVLQLYVKIPFLILPAFGEQFKTLETKIKESLGVNFIIKEKIIENFDDIMNIDFLVPGTEIEQSIENILSRLAND